MVRHGLEALGRDDDEFTPPSEGEMWRIEKALYRVELHSQLYSAAHAGLVTGLEDLEFLRRMSPWDQEQFGVMSQWMAYRARLGRRHHINRH